MKHDKNIPKLATFLAFLALTVLSCSGSSGISGLFATETLTPTMTFTPSPTSTPTSTPTETATPSPTPLPIGVQVEEQSDGSTLFIDYDNQYQLSLPKDWTVIPLSSDDLATILSNLSEKNPALKDIAESFQQLDPDVIRVIAVNDNPKYFVNGYSTNMTVTAVKDPLMATMPLDFVTGAVEETLQQQGATIVNESTVTTNANGIEIGTFEFQKTTPTSTGASVMIRSKAILFQTTGKIVMIQLTTPQQFGEELFPILDDVLDSVNLLEL